MRHSAVLRAFAMLILLAPAACAQPAPLAADLLGTAPLPASTQDQAGQPVTITGLSGITWLGPSPGVGAAAQTDDYVAVMDNSSVLVRLRVTIATGGTAIQEVRVLGAVRFDQVRDWEAIAPGPRAGTVLLAEEGTPSVALLDPATGQIAWSAPAPPPFQNRRANRGFESLASSPASGIAWAANEEALTTDGPAASPSGTTVVRLVRWRVSPAGARPDRQHAYVVDRMPGPTVPGGSSGLAELVLLADGRLLALERSLSLTPGLFRSKLYEVNLDGATNVARFGTLAGASYTAASKRLLWEGSVQNLEGLCAGPRLRDGRTLLVGVVDDGDPVSVNTLVVLTLRGVGPGQTSAVRATSD